MTLRHMTYFSLSFVFMDIKSEEKDEEFTVDKDGNLFKTQAPPIIGSMKNGDVRDYSQGQYTKYDQPYHSEWNERVA